MFGCCPGFVVWVWVWVWVWVVCVFLVGDDKAIEFVSLFCAQVETDIMSIPLKCLITVEMAECTEIGTQVRSLA